MFGRLHFVLIVIIVILIIIVVIIVVVVRQGTQSCTYTARLSPSGMCSCGKGLLYENPSKINGNLWEAVESVGIGKNLWGSVKICGDL